MINLYKINGTSNINKEQHSDCYTDENFWPTFQNDMEKFKKNIIDSNTNNKSMSVLRMGHAEHCLFNLLVPYPKKGKIIVKGILPRHYTKQQSKETWIKMLESIGSSDYITTQIGRDFEKWICDLIHYKDIYIQFKQTNSINKLFNNPIYFSQNYKNEKMDMPLDIIYGLLANKWFLKIFKNQIGFIGNKGKLDIIKNLMKHDEYKKYIENDHFLEYIDIPQRCALEDDTIETRIFETVKNSDCKVYFIGAGASKLKFFYNLKKIKPNGIFIDIGHGLDAIAGIADYERPYFGSWQNYKMKNYDYSKIDFCGPPSWNNAIIL
jgi:hypothetical protein